MIGAQGMLMLAAFILDVCARKIERPFGEVTKTKARASCAKVCAVLRVKRVSNPF